MFDYKNSSYYEYEHTTTLVSRSSRNWYGGHSFPFRFVQIVLPFSKFYRTQIPPKIFCPWKKFLVGCDRFFRFWGDRKKSKKGSKIPPFFDPFLDPPLLVYSENTPNPPPPLESDSPTLLSKNGKTQEKVPLFWPFSGGGQKGSKNPLFWTFPIFRFFWWKKLFWGTKNLFGETGVLDHNATGFFFSLKKKSGGNQRSTFCFIPISMSN
jgi:hypothetical protein